MRPTARAGHVVRPARLEPTNERLAALRLPEGFRLARFAELQKPRMIAVRENGAVYVTQPELGQVTLLRDTTGDGRAEYRRVVAKRDLLHGLAIHQGKLYHFQLFALNTVLDLPRGFNRHTLLHRMGGHVLAQGQLVGTFQQP